MYGSLFVTYHQCRLVLYASHVPQLSGRPVPDDWPPTITRSSAKVALESAHSLSTLANDILLSNWSPASLAPFVGYCMFSSAATILTLSPVDFSQMPTKELKATFSSLKLLDLMRPYWKHLDRLVRVSSRAHDFFSHLRGFVSISP